MFEIFKTLLLLSGTGGVITVILIALKPITAKRFSARWQYYIWLVAMICMILPVWKVIPNKEAQKILPRAVAETAPRASDNQTQNNTVINYDVPMEYREIQIAGKTAIRIYDLIAYIWLGGMAVFLILAFGNYYYFLCKKRRSSICLSENEIFEQVKAELGIKRKIRVRISRGTDSPMLVGTFFPVIYLPENAADEITEKMVFRHELTHYRHGDLIYKWITLFISAAHWFNPLVYLLSANISEACEVFCDMSVIKEMDGKNRDLYMKTILNLAEKNGGK